MLLEIIRVETPDGAGIYRGTKYSCYAPDRQHPLPWEDGIDYTPAHFFGFDSAEQYFAWFGFEESWLEMAKCNLQLSLHLVPQEHCIPGRTQVAFNRAKAFRIAHAPIPYPGDSIEWKELPLEPIFRP